MHSKWAYAASSGTLGVLPTPQGHLMRMCGPSLRFLVTKQANSSQATSGFSSSTTLTSTSYFPMEWTTNACVTKSSFERKSRKECGTRQDQFLCKLMRACATMFIVHTKVSEKALKWCCGSTFARLLTLRSWLRTRLTWRSCSRLRSSRSPCAEDSHRSCRLSTKTQIWSLRNSARQTRYSLCANGDPSLRTANNSSSKTMDKRPKLRLTNCATLPMTRLSRASRHPRTSYSRMSESLFSHRVNPVPSCT